MIKTKTWQEVAYGTDAPESTKDTVSFEFFKPILHDVLSKLEGSGQVHIPLANTTDNSKQLKQSVNKYGIPQSSITSNWLVRNEENLHDGYIIRYHNLKLWHDVLKQRKSVMTTKIADKLTKINESFTINMYDNGYMVEVGGRSEDDNWVTTKIICSSLDQVIEIVKEAAEMPRHD